MSIQRADWELPAGILKAAFLTPVAATLATWSWSYLANQIHPDWYARACVEHVPVPFWVGRAPAIIPGCMILVGLLTSGILVRHGHGWLAAILVLYYATTLFFLAVSNYLMFTPGFC